MSSEPSDSVQRHYDADGLDAVTAEEPTLTIGRLLYRGRVLSMGEWLPFYNALLAIDAKQLQGAARVTALHALHLRYLRTVFPRRRFRIWAPDPVRSLERAPGNGVEAAFRRFFSHQLRILFPPDPEPGESPTTSGAGSPDRTAAAVPAPTPP